MKQKTGVTIIIALILLAIIAGLLSGCNAQLIDTTYYIDKAMIKMPDGTVVSGKVESWKDYENSDAIQVKIDGVTYYTFLGNVVLMDK